MADWSLAVFTILGAGFYLRAASQLPRLLVGDTVGPQLFPELIGAGLLIGGLLLAWETWRKRAVTAPASETPASTLMPDVDAPRSATPVLIGVVVWTVVYYAAFEPVGYVVSTVLYASALLCFFHRVRWYWNVLIAAAFTGIAFAVFQEALGVVLPAGVLELVGAGS